LTAEQQDLNRQIKSQEAYIKALNVQLDAANAYYDEQNAILDRLQDNQSKYSDLMNQAKDNIQNFANTGITGMRAMDDQIFANTQAQKSLQLQMMNLEDVTGRLTMLQIDSRLCVARSRMLAVSARACVQLVRALKSWEFTTSRLMHFVSSQLQPTRRLISITNCRMHSRIFSVRDRGLI
jgi:chromosome segregation ATPase